MQPLEPLSVAAVHTVLARAGLDEETGVVEIRLNEEHSNSLAAVRFGSGRTLIVKRARYAWMAERFDVSCEASRLLHERQPDVLAPRYLEIPDEASGLPTLLYWWIPAPTLDDVWAELGPGARESALEECGRLLRRIHVVSLPGHGPLLRSLRGGHSLERFLREDLDHRLRPAMEGVWPRRVPSLERFGAIVSTALSGREEPPPLLVHNDLFTANVLCESEGAGVHCVGALDFEDCFAGPGEADLAKTELLHGPLFGRALQGSWFERVLQGYGGEPDPVLLSLFRVYHLLNMGYHAAATGLRAHAAEVGAAIDRELDRWADGIRHRDALR